MLELFFIERGLLRTITRSLRDPVITNKNKAAYQRPTPVLFVLQLLQLLLAEFSLFFF